jgi:GDPmannose 4,6-dehydratase
LVLATGETTTVRAFCEMAFAHLGIKLKWEGEGVNEKGIVDDIDEEQYEASISQQLNSSTLSEGEVLIEVDPKYFRPTEVEMLLGDPAKARERLGWESEFSIKELVKDMIESDYQAIGDVQLLTSKE